MKGVVLCSEAKQCTECGAKLKMRRKTMPWIYDELKTRVTRETTVFTCGACNIDFVIRGTHRDDSGFKPMHLPIRDLEEDPPRRHNQSTVKTYYDPDVIQKSSPEKKSKEHARKNDSPRNRRENDSRSDVPAIRRARTPKRSCEMCEFWRPTKQFCGLHYKATRSNEYCKRFKRNFIRIYPGGGVSPR